MELLSPDLSTQQRLSRAIRDTDLKAHLHSPPLIPSQQWLLPQIRTLGALATGQSMTRRWGRMLCTGRCWLRWRRNIEQLCRWNQNLHQMENSAFIQKLNCQIGKEAGSRIHLGGAQEASRGAESYVGATKIPGMCPHRWEFWTSPLVWFIKANPLLLHHRHHLIISNACYRSISDSGKIDIFLKKKSEQLAKKKKKLMSKSKVAERKELLNHLRLVAKLETEVRLQQKYGKVVDVFLWPNL